MSKTCYVDHILRHALVLPNNKMVSGLLFPPLMLCLHLPASHSYILGHMKAFMAQEKRVLPFLSPACDAEGQSG